MAAAAAHERRVVVEPHGHDVRRVTAVRAVGGIVDDTGVVEQLDKAVIVAIVGAMNEGGKSEGIMTETLYRLGNN